jgi:hypothetical protein
MFSEFGCSWAGFGLLEVRGSARLGFSGVSWVGSYEWCERGSPFGLGYW